MNVSEMSDGRRAAPRRFDGPESSKCLQTPESYFLGTRGVRSIIDNNERV